MVRREAASLHKTAPLERGYDPPDGGDDWRATGAHLGEAGPSLSTLTSYSSGVT